MGKKVPDAPDYAAAAEKTAASSEKVTNQQTWANRPDQRTPWGTESWNATPTKDPVTGETVNKWTQTTNLNAESQRALDSQLALTSGRSELASSLLPRAQQEFGNAMDWSQFQDMDGNLSPENLQRSISTDGMQNVDGSQKYYDKAEDAVYNKWSNRQEPRMQAEMDRNRTQLYNQGLKEGDAAYEQQMKLLRENQNDAREQAQLGATTAAGAEAQRMQGMDTSLRGQQFGERQGQGAFANTAANQAFGQQQAAAGFQNTARQAQIAEEMQRRGFSLNEINAILTGQQVGMPSMPGFQGATKSETTDYSGAAKNQYSAAQDAANAQNAGLNSLMGAAGSLGSTAMMFSDRRLKENIVPLFRWKGLQFYSYTYISQFIPRIGVMADEVAHIPGAVHRHPSGYDMVDYGVIYGR